MVMELQYQKVLFSNERTRAESGSKQFPVDRLNENLCVSGEQIVRYYDAKKYPRIFTEAENRAKLTLTFTSYLVLLSTEETRIQEAEEASTAATMAPSFYLRHRRGRGGLDMGSDRADKGQQREQYLENGWPEFLEWIDKKL
jgi:hypothetical protein